MPLATHWEPMTQWRERADQLCYDGESVVEAVPLDPAGVVVTTHRVLAFTPEADGANYRAVERPNVGGVTPAAEGSDRALSTAIKALVVGVVLVGAGQLFSLDGLAGSVELNDAATGQLGMGGMLATLQQVFQLLALLDDALVVLGALVLVLAAGALGWYARTRKRLLRLAVAGDEDLVVPAPEDESAVDRLDEAIRPDDGPTDRSADRAAVDERRADDDPADGAGA